MTPPPSDDEESTDNAIIMIGGVAIVAIGAIAFLLSRKGVRTIFTTKMTIMRTTTTRKRTTSDVPSSVRKKLPITFRYLWCL